jgi:hypothetical protein
LDWPLEIAERFPNALARVRFTVKPYRDTVKRKSTRERWWIYNEDRPGMRRALSNLRRVIVKVLTSNTWAFVFMPTYYSFDQALIVIFLEDYGSFAVLQSRVHEVWSKWVPSTMKSDTRYTIARCVTNFPRPKNLLEDAGQTGKAYDSLRSSIMSKYKVGLTHLYNKFHSLTKCEVEIQYLRELHDELDHAVLRAYGWGDLADDLRPEFLTAKTEDDRTYQGRYFWPAEARDRVLARLLALNAERHAEEVAAGRAPAARARASAEDDDEAEPGLDID